MNRNLIAISFPKTVSQHMSARATRRKTGEAQALLKSNMDIDIASKWYNLRAGINTLKQQKRDMFFMSQCFQRVT